MGDEEDPDRYYSYKISESLEDGSSPIIEYFDKDGNNVTPLPLHLPDDEDEEHVR